MSRPDAVLLNGRPLTLAGCALEVGQVAPDFELHYYQRGIQTLTLANLNRPTLMSVVPSLQADKISKRQTKRFNKKIKRFGNSIYAYTISSDLPFAQKNFRKERNIRHMSFASDYQTHQFGEQWGLLIEEVMLLARAVYVLDAHAKVMYADVCSDLTCKPNYTAAISAIENAVKGVVSRSFIF